MIAELVVYFWSFFSGAITALQMIFKPEWIVRTLKFAVTGDRSVLNE